MAVFLNEILVHIFNYLDASSLTKVSLVCKQWANVAKTPKLWKRLVLKKWTSQHFLYLNAPLTCTDWIKVYQDLYFRGKFSPDDQRYFISCRVGEDELDPHELRLAMLEHMAKVTEKWTIVEPFEAEDSRNFPSFNLNFDMYYDTHDLVWKFIDKRQEYIEDLMGCKLASKLQRKSRFIRPYQVMPSCLLLYRWLALFRTIGSDENGLTFYRIWRYHLKHKDTGLLFEVCDWKAAMSCSFLRGKPPHGKYMDDCLELMSLLSHPHFIMHPLGLPLGVFRAQSVISPPSEISRQASLSSLSSSNTPRSLAGSTNTLEKLTDSRIWLWPLSGTESDDDESELVCDDSGYYSNCEFFISINHWDVEEQQTIQTSVAESWSLGQLPTNPQLYLSFDAVEENWYFYSYCSPDFKENDLMALSDSMSKHMLDNSAFHGLNMEPIPSCLALYRLICLFDLVYHSYRCLDEASLWALTLVHSATGGLICMRDKNGWFEISVCLTEDQMNELKDSQQNDTNRPSTSDQSQPVDSAMEICNKSAVEWSNDYDGDDDNSDDDGNTDDGIHDDHDELGTLSSSHEDHDIDEFLAMDLPLESYIDEQSNMEHPPEQRNDSILDFYQGDEHDIQNQGEMLYPLPMVEEPGVGNHSNLDLLKADVVTLLNLLTSEKFGHPYGTIAGCVA